MRIEIMRSDMNFTADTKTQLTFVALFTVLYINNTIIIYYSNDCGKTARRISMIPEQVMTNQRLYQVLDPIKRALY